MAYSIPLIRSAVLFPMLRWLRENGGPSRDRLRAADLGYVTEDAPERPVPLYNVFAFFRIMADAEGPDIGARVIGPHSVTDLGTFGSVILAARTPREALLRAATVLPRYSTHELLSFQRGSGHLRLHAGWSMALDDVTLHLTQQFSAALVVGLCLAAKPAVLPMAVRIRPHPRHGIEHLRPWFGAALSVATEAMLEVELKNQTLDAPLSNTQSLGTIPPVEDWPVLKGDLSCAQSVRLLMQSMQRDPPVTTERLARSGGLSARSLQRALASEGTCIRNLRDDMHRDNALQSLPDLSRPLASLARDLGFAEQSCLSRAVRRWTGLTPRRLRADLSDLSRTTNLPKPSRN